MSADPVVRYYRVKEALEGMEHLKEGNPKDWAPENQRALEWLKRRKGDLLHEIKEAGFFLPQSELEPK